MEYTFLEKTVEPLVAEFDRHDKFSLDIETTGLSPIDSRILLTQIGFPGGINFVIPNHKVDISPLLRFISSPKWETIIHNAKFESKFFQYHHNTVISGIFDTYLAELLIMADPNAPASLADVALKYLGIVVNKDTRSSFIGMNPMEAFTSEQLEYAAKDVDILFGIADAQREILHEKNLEHVAEIEFDLASTVANMENVGVPIDAAKWKIKLSEVAIEHEQSRKKIIQYLFSERPVQSGMFEDGEPLDKKGKPVNINSPDQIGAALVKIGVKLPKNPETGNLKTDERTLANIKHPATQEIVHYRGLQKIMTSYGQKSFLDKIHPFTGRIHADWRQLGTETGRFSCEKPNLQQLPDAFRQCVVAGEGYKLVVADYSQIELRIIAEMSDDKAMIAAFNSEYDLHTATAATMFNTDPDKVSKDERFAAKTINFGLAYGMGPPKLRDTLNAKREKGNLLTMTAVNILIDRHKAAFKDAVLYLKHSGLQAYGQGYSRTMLNRIRYFQRPEGSDPKFVNKVEQIKREGANAPIQGTNADITKLAMSRLFHELRDYHHRADIILAIHDEIVVLAHNSEAEAVKYLVEDSMKQSAQTVLKKVPVVVEAIITDIWKK
jgi:DNA polymerase I